MFLKTLSIKGFKSFAEPTTLRMEPGVTVVVGPNGSGKSNVVDAIGWVLGAQAPSAVRSQKMDDVIFAGTAARAALGRAEVALTIDNSSGLLPIEFTEVTVRRTLFRSGDSEYAINGVPCRLLDIQELLSDSGVGRQQHVIISQGQIDAVLNARPEDRRLIIEEAAGVLKFRRRKEKAERRLDATEGSLTRLQDLLRERRRQLRPLERQAEAARRHGDLVGELHHLRLYLAGQELARLQGRMTSGAAQRAQLEQRVRELQRTLGDLDTQVLATEAQLNAMGGADVSDRLARFEALREKARGQAALLAERARGIERERGATLDQAVVANLEADAARLGDELVELEREAEQLVPLAERLQEAEGELERERVRFQTEWADGVPAPSSRAAEVRGELAALRAGVERSQGEAERARVRLERVQQKTVRLSEEAARLEVELEATVAAAPGLVDARAAAVQTREAAEQRLVEADEVRRRADADRHTWSARADALATALDAARARAGAERLAGLDGVLGTLLDLVEVDAGYEAAFEAAAGEAIAAVVVDGVPRARAALAHLASSDVAGAVLALGGVSQGVTPTGGASVRARVRSLRPEVERLLDLLVGGVGLADSWEAAIDVALADPTRTVVTPAGDRVGPGGWRLGAGGAGATGAALEEATSRAAAAKRGADEAETAQREAKAMLDSAQRAERDAARAADQSEHRRRSLDDTLRRLRADLADTDAEIDTLAVQHRDLNERIVRDDQRVKALEADLPELERAEAELVAAARAMAEARERLEARAGEVGALRSDLEVRSVGIDERRQFLQTRRQEAEQRLARHAAERIEAEARRTALERRAVATQRLTAFVAERLVAVEAEVAVLREQRQRQTDEAREVSVALDGLRRSRSASEKDLDAQRERSRRAELEETEVRLRLEQVVERVRGELDAEPEVAISVEAPELAEGVVPAARVRDLERELRSLGPINPLALEEFEAMREEVQFLDKQLEDVRTSRRELGKVIRAIDVEIIEKFAAAYADVEDNFSKLFEMLFPGGTGKLRLTDPENLLETGIEVEARPSGKNVRKLSLLSGGERSLTALAYLFAVFRSRPSPFYVMDEVEAALDDVNLHRFLDLVQEFRADAQLIIVSHQKRTMEAADCLYGVTSREGVSRVVSEKTQD